MLLLVYLWFYQYISSGDFLNFYFENEGEEKKGEQRWGKEH